MEKNGHIEIRINGSIGNVELKPNNYDIREILSVLEHAESLLFPNEKKERPTISYQLEEGSVRHIFKTSIQTIIGFNAILAQINNSQSIDFLESTTARAIESFQNTAIKKNYYFTINTSIQETNELSIDKTTKFYRTEAIWSDAEFYFYGKVTNAGGKDKANIHVVTEELGSIRIETPQEILENLEDNILYKSFGIRVIGKQHSETGEIDKSTLKFIELIDYSPKYDENYVKELRKKAMNWLNTINPEEWLSEIRGGYDA